MTTTPTSAQQSGSGQHDFAWLIGDFVRRVPGTTHATVVSADGLLLASSPGLPKDKADQMAAVTSGMNSLARGASRIFGGGQVAQTIMEMANGYLFLMSVSNGSCLAVLGSRQADIGLVVYEMTLLVDRVGRHLSVEPRSGVRVPERQ